MLLVRDDPFEVLMVRRTDRRDTAFPSALVFPGGVVDPDDASPDWLPHVTGAEGLSGVERGLRIAACRETFEEAGIVLASDGVAVCAARDTAPGAGFRELLARTGTTLPLDTLVPYAHWITPELAPKRYDTRFYICRAPDGAKAICDGGETLAVEWIAPGDALRLDGIVFVTRMNLIRLAESDGVESALAAARARPHFTVEPELVRRDGGYVVTIPAAAGYGITEDERAE